MTTIPLAIVLVIRTVADLYLFESCAEPSECDSMRVQLYATAQECQNAIHQDRARRLRFAIEAGYDPDSVMGTFSGCDELRIGVLSKLCSQTETLHALAACSTLPPVPGHTPSTNASRTPRPQDTRRGVSVLGVL